MWLSTKFSESTSKNVKEFLGISKDHVLEAFPDESFQESVGDFIQTIDCAGKEIVVVRSDYFEALLKDVDLLEALLAHGVDNWVGYSDALESISGEDE